MTSAPGLLVQRPCGRDSPTTCGACPPRHCTILELPGALPLLQRHLRGREEEARPWGHPQPRLPLSIRFLRARRLLPRARVLPARRRRGRSPVGEGRGEEDPPPNRDPSTLLTAASPSHP